MLLFAVNKLFDNIKTHIKPDDDGKGAYTLEKLAVEKVIQCFFDAYAVKSQYFNLPKERYLTKIPPQNKKQYCSLLFN